MQDITNGPQRSSKLSIITSLSQTLIYIIFILFINRGEDSFFFIAVLIGLLLVVTITVVAWLNNTYELCDKELVLRSGVFNKHESHIPYKHIHTVNTTSSLFQRIFNLVTLDIDTAGSSTELNSGQIKGLKNDIAASLMSYISAKRDNKNVDVDEVTGQAVGMFPLMDTGSVYVLTKKELFFASFSKMRIGVGILLIFGFLNWADDVLNGFDIDTPGVENIDLIALGWKAAISMVIFILIICMLVSFISNFFRFSNFKAINQDDNLTVERGLLTKTVNNVPVERIQGIHLEQGFVARLMGYESIYAYVVGNAGSKDDANDTVDGLILLHPFIKSDRTDDFILEILPQYIPAFDNKDSVVVPKRAYGRIFRKKLYITTFLVGITYGIWYAFDWFEVSVEASLLIIRVVAILIGINLIRQMYSAYLYTKETGVYVADKFMVLTEGGWVRNTDMLPQRALQYSSIHQSIFQKQKDLSDFAVDTAADNFAVLIGNLDNKSCETLYNWIIQ